MIIQCIEQLIQYFNGERRFFELPLNQEGTPFQKQVWNELASIPFGKTISYLELAIKMGDPKATRAVAAANGKNARLTKTAANTQIRSTSNMVLSA